MKKIKYVSKCCKAEIITIMSPDFIGDNPKTMKIGTCHFGCSKCNKPCDIIKKRGKHGKTS